MPTWVSKAEDCWQLGTDLFSTSCHKPWQCIWYQLVVWSLWKMSTDMSQPFRFWLCSDSQTSRVGRCFDNRELKKTTFLTTRTLTGNKLHVLTSHSSAFLLHDVRVVKNVACLSSLMQISTTCFLNRPSSMWENILSLLSPPPPPPKKLT